MSLVPVPTASSDRENARRSTVRRHWLLGLLFGLSLAVADEFQLSEQTLRDIEQSHGQPARARAEELKELIETQQALPELEKLERINRFINRLEFVTDHQHWGQLDYWATPIETLSTNGGDCEDFSIAKYFALREMGVAEDRLRLTYVKALSINQAHMVLTYFPTPDAEPLVLDNLDGEIKPASERGDLVPVYSFNGDGLWLAKERNAGKRVGGSERISLWRKLIQRMEQGQ